MSCQSCTFSFEYAMQGPQPWVIRQAGPPPVQLSPLTNASLRTASQGQEECSGGAREGHSRSIHVPHVTRAISRSHPLGGLSGMQACLDLPAPSQVLGQGHGQLEKCKRKAPTVHGLSQVAGLEAPPLRDAPYVHTLVQLLRSTAVLHYHVNGLAPALPIYTRSDNATQHTKYKSSRCPS